MRMIGTGMILLGIVIFSIVGYQWYQERSVQQRMLHEIEQLEVGEKSSAQTGNQAAPKEGSAIGELSIPKIDLRVAMAEGAGQEDLRYAVGHLPQSGRLGKMNENFVVLGHRSYTSGKFFNRLNEVEKGDEILLRNAEGAWKYVVTEKRIISPDQVEVTKPVSGRSMVTLITCHPMYSSKQRLVVFAEKEDKKSE